MITDIFDLISGEISLLDFVISVGATAFVVFCAAPLHEFAHAFVAVKLGDETPRNRGRLTINPMAHIDPIGALLIFLCGFGYAKPVEVRMRHFKKPKRDMALVALAGPVCNLIQAFVFLFISNFFTFSYVKASNDMMMYISLFFYFAATININLAVFNLLPIPPLDGSRLATALLPTKIYFKIMEYERYIQIALFVLLLTGVLTTPLSILSGLVAALFQIITSIPFSFIS